MSKKKVNIVKKKPQNKIKHDIFKKRILPLIMSNKKLSLHLFATFFFFIVFFFAMGIIRSLLFTIIINILLLPFFRKKKDKNSKRSFWNKFLIGAMIMAIAVFIVIFIAVGIIIVTAPEFDPNAMYRADASILFDKDGNEIAKLGLQRRVTVTYNELPDVLVDAIIATEDARFFQHNGFDLPRFIVASVGQVLGKDSGGASTLTMQVSKNNYTSTKSTGLEGLKRKFTDIYMAIFQIESNYTKEEIIEFYVNQPFLGGGSYGVEQASITYFNKSVKDLNLSEAAIIAGLFQAPNTLDPFRNPHLTEKRRNTVLYLMERHGYITNEERTMAASIPVEDMLTNRPSTVKYQDFIDTVVEEVIKKTGKNPYSTSMIVYTTMDPKKQDHINAVMSGELWQWENDLVMAGVAVTSIQDGSIAAIGAGRNRSGQRQFNNATMIKRQMGSTAKPFYDYGPAIEYNNWSTYHQFVDEPHAYSNGINISNWDSKFNGLMTMRTALVQSRNIPALKTFQRNDNAKILEFAKNVGLSPEVSGGRIHEAHSLGGYNGESPLTTAAAYATFARGGIYIEPYSFTKITFLSDNSTYENKPVTKRAMSEATAYMMTSMLVDAAKSYGRISGVTYYAKTGTTDYPRETMDAFKLPNRAVNDLWIIGSTPNYSLSVWYGYDRVNSQYYNILSSRQQVRLFLRIGEGVFEKNSSFKTSKDVVSVAIEKESWPAMLPSANTPDNMIVTELFKKGTEPTIISPRYNTLPNVTNLSYVKDTNKVTFSWDRIETPDAINPDYLNDYFRTLYTDSATRTRAVSARNNYNNTVMGNITYNIYRKNSDDSLTLVGTTTNESFEVNIFSSGTYVVKTSYTIFKASASTGVTINVSIDNSINSVLNGSTPLSLNIDDIYIEQSVTVLENSIDVSSLSTIIRTIKNGLGETVASIDTSTEGTYTITYSVTYKTYTRNHTRIVNIN
jgi:penicillin-binding protein 1A